jgi:hypothetical protein
MRLVKLAAAASVAIIAVAGVSRWQADSMDRPNGPTFGRATTNPAVAADVSPPLSTLSPPGESAIGSSDPEEREQEGRSSTPIRMEVSRASAAVEQLAPGTKPPPGSWPASTAKA